MLSISSTVLSDLPFRSSKSLPISSLISTAFSQPPTECLVFRNLSGHTISISLLYLLIQPSTLACRILGSGPTRSTTDALSNRMIRLAILWFPARSYTMSSIEYGPASVKLSVADDWKESTLVVHNSCVCMLVIKVWFIKTYKHTHFILSIFSQTCQYWSLHIDTPLGLCWHIPFKTRSMRDQKYMCYLLYGILNSFECA